MYAYMCVIRVCVLAPHSLSCGNGSALRDEVNMINTISTISTYSVVSAARPVLPGNS